MMAWSPRDLGVPEGSGADRPRLPAIDVTTGNPARIWDYWLGGKDNFAADREAARKVMELLCDLNRSEGLSVVVSLHQVDYAMRYCPRVVALKAGRVVYDGPSTGLDHARLVDIYGPEIEEVFWEGGRS